MPTTPTRFMLLGGAGQGCNALRMEQILNWNDSGNQNIV